MFYKKEDDKLLVGSNFVLNANYELRIETYTEHTYPIDDWYWIVDDDTAYTQLGVTKPIKQCLKCNSNDCNCNCDC
jgi:hypothetical protein